MDNPIVGRILAKMREETKQKMDDLKLDLISSLKKKDDEQRDKTFRHVLRMFKALRGKCKDDYSKEKEQLEIRVADLETQGLLESDPETPQHKSTEQGQGLEFISEEYDHLLPWIKQADVEHENIERRVGELEKQMEKVQENQEEILTQLAALER